MFLLSIELLNYVIKLHVPKKNPLLAKKNLNPSLKTAGCSCRTSPLSSRFPKNNDKFLCRQNNHVPTQPADY